MVVVASLCGSTFKHFQPSSSPMFFADVVGELVVYF